MNPPLWTLAAVLVLIAFRHLAGGRLRIWQIVLGGAPVVLLTGGISPRDAWRAIDWEVIGFLFGVFVLGQALAESGLLGRASALLLGRVRGAGGLVLAILLAGGLASALLMNDTLAVIGTPLMLALARAHRLPPNLLLLALAFGITIAGKLTLMGAASNIIIVQAAESRGAHLGFWRFLAVGAPLTVLNLLVYWLFLG